MVFLGSWVAVFAHCLLLAAGGTASAGSYCSEQQDATSDDVSTLVVALQPRQQQSRTGQLAEAGVASVTMDAQSATDVGPEIQGKSYYPALRCSLCREKHGSAYCKHVCDAFPSKFQGQKVKGKDGQSRPCTGPQPVKEVKAERRLEDMVEQCCYGSCGQCNPPDHSWCDSQDVCERTQGDNGGCSGKWLECPVEPPVPPMPEPPTVAGRCCFHITECPVGLTIDNDVPGCVDVSNHCSLSAESCIAPQSEEGGCDGTNTGTANVFCKVGS